MIPARAASAPDMFGAFLPGEPVAAASTGKGALDGLGFAVKDLIDVAGHPTGGGNPDWLSAQRPAAQHATAVSSLLSAGAHLIGKTVTDELAFSLEGNNVHYGTPINPRNANWLPGGSSSGSAVAVASGLADFALGTDTGGSVRVPAAFCGIFGFRPSHGLVSFSGVQPFAPSYDTLGWFARTATTLSAVGDRLLPSTDVTPITRLRSVTDIGSHVHPDVAADIERAAAKIATHDPIELLSKYTLPFVATTYSIIQDYEIKMVLGSKIKAIKPHFAPDIAARFADALATESDAYQTARMHRLAISAHVAQICPPDTVLILPCVSQRHLNKSAGAQQIGQFYGATLGLTAFAGHWQAPQVQLGLAAGDESVGISLLGAPGSDRALLNLAVEITAHLEGSQ